MKPQNSLGVLSILGGFYLPLRPLWALWQNKKMQNKANFSRNQDAVKHLNEKTYSKNCQNGNWVRFFKRTQFTGNADVSSAHGIVMPKAFLNSKFIIQHSKLIMLWKIGDKSLLYTVSGNN